MSNNAENIKVFTDGILTIVKGHTDREDFPVFVNDPITGGLDLGFMDESGASASMEVSTRNINAWQELNVKTVEESRGFTVDVTALETNAVTRYLLSGIEPDTNGVYDFDNAVLPKVTVYLDLIDGDTGARTRWVFNATVTLNGSVDFSRTTETTYPLRFTSNGQPKLITEASGS